MVPWYHGDMVPWYHGSMVPWYHGGATRLTTYDLRLDNRVIPHDSQRGYRVMPHDSRLQKAMTTTGISSPRLTTTTGPNFKEISQGLNCVFALRCHFSLLVSLRLPKVALRCVWAIDEMRHIHSLIVYTGFMLRLQQNTCFRAYAHDKVNDTNFKPKMF